MKEWNSLLYRELLWRIRRGEFSDSFRLYRHSFNIDIDDDDEKEDLLYILVSV